MHQETSKKLNVFPPRYYFLMRYLTKNVLGTVCIMCAYATYGFLASENTNFVLILLTLTGSFVLAYVITWAKIGVNNKFFESQSNDKLRFYMFFRRSVYLASFIIFISIISIISGTLDYLPLIKSILKSVVFILLVIVAMGISSLLLETIPTNFNYIIYRGLLNLATKSHHEKQNLHFLSGIRYYDKYLRRRFGLAINNLETIFNRYALMQAQDRSAFLQSLVASEQDPFAPIGEFNMRFDLSGDILVKVSDIQKLRDLVSFIVPIIALATTIIQLLINL